MPTRWHRVGVYLGLLEDPELRAQWEQTRPDWRTTALGWALAAVTVIVGVALALLAIRLVFGGDTRIGDVLADAVRWVWLALVVGTIGAGSYGWWRRRGRRLDPR